MKTQYCSAQPQGKHKQGSGPDHTPAYILSYATEGISRTLILFSLEGGCQVHIINNREFLEHGTEPLPPQEEQGAASHMTINGRYNNKKLSVSKNPDAISVLNQLNRMPGTHQFSKEVPAD